MVSPVSILYSRFQNGVTLWLLLYLFFTLGFRMELLCGYSCIYSLPQVSEWSYFAGLEDTHDPLVALPNWRQGILRSKLLNTIITTFTSRPTNTTTKNKLISTYKVVIHVCLIITNYIF